MLLRGFFHILLQLQSALQVSFLEPSDIHTSLSWRNNGSSNASVNINKPRNTEAGNKDWRGTENGLDNPAGPFHFYILHTGLKRGWKVGFEGFFL